MKKNTSRIQTEQIAPVTARRSAPSPAARETVEEAIARVRALPGFLDQIGPEAIAQFQREMGDHPEVLGRLPGDPPWKPNR